MSNTILPPRVSVDTLAALPAFPIDADVTESLRPTWIPVDPATFVPPSKRRSRAGLFALGAVGALTIWALGFAATLGAQSLHEQWTAERAAAATQATTITKEAPTTKPAPTPVQARAASATSSDDVVLTVNVNDLPRSKDFSVRKKI